MSANQDASGQAESPSPSTRQTTVATSNDASQPLPAPPASPHPANDTLVFMAHGIMYGQPGVLGKYLTHYVLDVVGQPACETASFAYASRDLESATFNSLEHADPRTWDEETKERLGKAAVELATRIYLRQRDASHRMVWKRLSHPVLAQLLLSCLKTDDHGLPFLDMAVIGDWVNPRESRQFEGIFSKSKIYVAWAPTSHTAGSLVYEDVPKEYLQEIFGLGGAEGVSEGHSNPSRTGDSGSASLPVSSAASSRSQTSASRPVNDPMPLLQRVQLLAEHLRLLEKDIETSARNIGQLFSEIKRGSKNGAAERARHRLLLERWKIRFASRKLALTDQLKFLLRARAKALPDDIGVILLGPGQDALDLEPHAALHPVAGQELAPYFELQKQRVALRNEVVKQLHAMSRDASTSFVHTQGYSFGVRPEPSRPSAPAKAFDNGVLPGAFPMDAPQSTSHSTIGLSTTSVPSAASTPSTALPQSAQVPTETTSAHEGSEGGPSGQTDAAASGSSPHVDVAPTASSSDAVAPALATGHAMDAQPGIGQVGMIKRKLEALHRGLPGMENHADTPPRKQQKRSKSAPARGALPTIPEDAPLPVTKDTPPQNVAGDSSFESDSSGDYGDVFEVHLSADDPDIF